MTERSGSTKNSIFATVVVLVGLYLFFTAYSSASSDPSPLRLVRTSGALVALGLLFLMIQLTWRPLVQFAVAGGLSFGLPITYAFIWERGGDRSRTSRTSHLKSREIQYRPGS